MSEARTNTAVGGTGPLGRPLTDRERAHLSALLRAHDFVGASMVALRFAYKLRRNKQAAHDLLGRASLRLVRQGWDPQRVSLVKCMCRLVWSEHTNDRSESATARRAEEVFLEQEEMVGRNAVRSAEDLAGRIEAERTEAELARTQIDALRAAFEQGGDEVNLLWLQYWLDDVTELSEMARLSGRDVNDFYRAADRRKRHVKRLLAQRAGAKNEEDT